MGSKRLWAATAASVVLPISFLWLVLPARREEPPSFAEPRPERRWQVDSAHAKPLRDQALKQARVWAAPAAPADVSRNPPDPSGQLSGALVRCRYVSKEKDGTTPKFDCVLSDGEVVRVKYGWSAEIPAEVAATRLMAALGFGADRMYLIPRLRCYGCGRSPFYTFRALDFVHARDVVAETVPDDRYTDFEWVTVERRFPGVTIESADDEGWAWFELTSSDESEGASRTERDALRLAAMLLAHWDNKASNQRLVCRTPDRAAPCARPFALMQDLGSTFGPSKINLEQWRRTPIWTDRARCLVSMQTFPYGGGTFPDAQISEPGRQLLSRQLAELTDPQLTDLFAAARFPEFHGGRGPGADAREWAAALRSKIREIADGGPCPP